MTNESTSLFKRFDAQLLAWNRHRFLNFILLVLWVVFSAGVVEASYNQARYLPFSLFGWSFTAVLLLLMRRGETELVSQLFVGGLFIGVSANILLVDQNIRTFSILGFFALVPLSNLLHGRRISIGLALLAALVISTTYLLQVADLVVLPVNTESSVVDLFIVLLILAFTTMLQQINTTQLQTIAEHAQEAALALDQIRADLEERVAQRTAAYAMVNEQLAAEVVERTRAEEALRVREQRLQRQALAMTQLAQSTAVAQGELEKASHQITQMVSEVLALERVSLWFYNEGRERLVCFDIYHRTTDQHELEDDLSITNYPDYEEALSSHRVIVANEAQTDPRTAVLAPYLARHQINAMMEVPLWRNQTVVGVLCVEHTQESRQWELDEIQFVSSVGDFIALTIEINDRLRIADTLHKSEERYRRMVELSPDGILIIQNGRISFANRALAKLAGVANVAELEGTTWDDLIYPEDHQTARRQAQKINDPDLMGTVISQSYRRMDGMLLEVEITATNIDYQGEPAIQLFVRDVTERNRVEKAMRQAQKSESLGVLAGGIAHDFNNLLVAMMGQSSLALRLLDEQDRAARPVQKSLQAAQRASDLTRQLLAYSGRGQFETRAISLNQLIEENLHLFEVAIPKHISLQMALAPQLPPIMADTGQLQQVVMNLLINAADAIGQQPGQIMISTAVYDAQPDRHNFWQSNGQPLPAGQYVLVEVADTGCGMAPSTVQQIFDPFFTTKPTGHGLGLAAVLGIIRGHKGGIQVDSTMGEGTSFRVLFPALSQEQPITNNFPLPPRLSGQLSGQILLIDDEEPVREAVRDILQNEGVQLLLAENGEVGIALYTQYQVDIDVVLLDLSMPGLTGGETLQRLRALNPAVPVILSSGFSKNEAIKQFIGQGLADFLQKPYQMETLLAKLQQYLTAAVPSPIPVISLPTNDNDERTEPVKE